MAGPPVIIQSSWIWVNYNISLTWIVRPWLGMIPLTNYDFQGSGEQGSVVMNFTQMDDQPTTRIETTHLQVTTGDQQHLHPRWCQSQGARYLETRPLPPSPGGSFSEHGDLAGHFHGKRPLKKGHWVTGNSCVYDCIWGTWKKWDNFLGTSMGTVGDTSIDGEWT